MEEHYHDTCEIIHDTEPLNDCLDALAYKQTQPDERIQIILKTLLKLELDSATKFLLREILAE